MSPRLPLNILVNRRCQCRCPFCVEDTVDGVNGDIDTERCIDIINTLYTADKVESILLLGGKPLLHPGLIKIIQSMPIPPIITTNGMILSKNKEILRQIIESPIRTVNVSIHHYKQEQNAKLMGSGYSFDGLKDAIKGLKSKGISVRMNTLLIKGYIDNLEEIEKMVDFAKWLNMDEVKFGELTAYNPDIHDFIKVKVLDFNNDSNPTNIILYNIISTNFVMS